MTRYKRFGIISIESNGVATSSDNPNPTGIFKLFDEVLDPLYESVYRGFIAVDGGKIVAAQDLSILEGEDNEFDAVRVLRKCSETMDSFICDVGFFLQGRNNFLGGGKNLGRIDFRLFNKITEEVTT